MNNGVAKVFTAINVPVAGQIRLHTHDKSQEDMDRLLVQLLSELGACDADDIR